jgi:hypothetical protein
MKVKDLIKALSSLPQNADVLYEGGEYKDDWRDVYKVKYEENLGWGKKGVVIG